MKSLKKQMRIIQKPRIMVWFYTILNLVPLILGQISQDTPKTPLTLGQIYFDISQDVRTMTYYSYTITGKNLKTDIEKSIGNMTAIRLDTQDPDSDPDLFISKTVDYPTQDYESDQVCTRNGPEYCILDNSIFKVGDTINIGIRCLNACKYSLRVIQPTVSQLNSSNVSEATTTVFLDQRSLNIFAYRIPQNTTDISKIANLQFTVISYQLESQMTLAYVVSNNFNLIQQRDTDLIIDGGKAIKFTTQDYGWCNNCLIYLIVNMRSASNLIIKTTLSPAMYKLEDQVAIERLVKSQQLECLSFNMLKAVNDAVFEINQYQGEMDILAYYRNLDTNEVSSDILVSSEMFQQRSIIVRSIDRQRLGPANGLIYLCIQAFSDSSLSIYPYQYYSFDKYDAVEDSLYSFVLDSKDSVYFRYTSVILQQSAVLNITVQSFSNLYNVPKVFYQICQSSNIDECSLSKQQQQGDKSISPLMTELVGQVDNLKNRYVTINHNPLMCPIPSNCIYLISVYNNDLSNPLKTTFKLTTSQPDPRPVMLFKQYYGVLDQGDNKYYQLVMSPTQIQTLTLSYLVVNLTSFNGRADLYASNITKNPNSNNYTQKSRTISPWTSLVYNVTGIDIMQKPVYFTVNANFRTTYSIKFDAIYTDITDPKESFSDITQEIILDGIVKQTSIDSTGNRTKVFAYSPVSENNNPRDIVLLLNVDSSPANTVLNYDVFYGNQKWLYLTGTNTIKGSQLQYVDGQTMTIVFRETQTSPYRYQSQYSLSSQPSDPKNLINFNFEIMAGGNPASNLIDTSVDQIYTAYTLDSSQLIYFRQYLIDTNGTYQFQIEPVKGTASVMFRTGATQPQFNKDESSTYFMQSIYDPNQNIHTIQTERQQREAASSICKNSSYTLRGGNNNCTMWIGVQCEARCLVKLSSSLIQAKTRTVAIPTLIQNNTVYSRSLARNKTDYYFMPFIRNQLKPTFAFLLQKQNNDLLMTMRVILNGFLPYFNWSYPTNTSADFVVRSNFTNPVEILEMQNVTLMRCLVNQSCIIIIGVTGNGPVNTSISNYQFTFFDQPSRISQEHIFTDLVESSNTYKYFWYIFNATANWRQTISMKINSLNDYAQLYVSINSCARPSDMYNLYKSDQFTSEIIQISSNDSYIKSFKFMPRMLVVIGVKALTPTVNFTLFNYGPNYYNTTFLNITDLTLNKSLNSTLRPINQKLTNNFQIFRYFNFDSKELRFGVSVRDGSLFVYTNIQRYQLTVSNPYFQIPLNASTSFLAPINLNKSQNTSIIFSDTKNTDYLCQFCWYYITVFQNFTTNLNAQTVFSINVTEPETASNKIPLIQSNFENIILQPKSFIQRRIVFQYKSEFSITVTSNSNASILAIISDHPDSTLENTIWTQSSNTSVVFSMSSIDPRFAVGRTYYLSVAAPDSLQNVTIAVNQFKQVNLLRDKMIVQNRMDTPQDFVKFYYYLLPKVGQNYTSSLTINVITPGFIPNIYLLKNDILNGSLIYSNLKYPTINNFSIKLENTFYSIDGRKTYNITFNNTAMNTTYQVPYLALQNQTFNVTTLQNVSTQVYNTTTKKNQIVYQMKNVTTQEIRAVNVTKFYNATAFNQSYYTMAIYWTTFGFTDYQKAEYELNYTTNIPANNVRLSVKQELPASQFTKFIEEIFPNWSHKYEGLSEDNAGHSEQSMIVQETKSNVERHQFMRAKLLPQK
ncbi:UNKNOWN [Stylonychia lemnae]|uniref:Uncharacterized protein n=1 Tax=Stylonychia lemnae TaxID=5949 RepID=A0A077ZP60_STYLE|nr:UNKNOWN [Stylonychia lemnae]|eukprot:CDW71175.1 UNKNOWN [Stylonychia lemnae]